MSAQDELIAKVNKTIQNFLPEIGKSVGVRSIEILNAGIREEDSWWYIPVLAKPEPKRSLPYYELLAEIEIDLDENHHLKVLFVPTSEDEIPGPPVH